MIDRPPTPVPLAVSTTLLIKLARPRAAPQHKYRDLQPYKKPRWSDFALNRNRWPYRTWATYARQCLTSILKVLHDRRLRHQQPAEPHRKLRAPAGRDARNLGQVKTLKEVFSRTLTEPRNGHSVIRPLSWFESKGKSYIPESFRDLPLRHREKRDLTGYQSKPSVSSSQRVTPVSRPAPPKQRVEHPVATGVGVHGAVPRVSRPQPHFERAAATSVKHPTVSKPTPTGLTKAPRKPPSDAEFVEAFIKALQIELSNLDAVMVRREAALQAALSESMREMIRKREESPPVRIPEPNYSLMKEGPPSTRPIPGGAGPSRGTEGVWTVPGWSEQPPANPARRRPTSRRAGAGGRTRASGRRETAAWKNCPCNWHPNRRPTPVQPRNSYIIVLSPPQMQFTEAAGEASSTNENASEITENADTRADEADNEQSARRRRRRRRRRGKKTAEDGNQEQQQSASPTPSMPNV